MSETSWEAKSAESLRPSAQISSLEKFPMSAHAEAASVVRYTPAQMVRFFSNLTTDALLLPDSLHAPLYARGAGSPKRVPPSILAEHPQQPELYTELQLRASDDEWPRSSSPDVRYAHNGPLSRSPCG